MAKSSLNFKFEKNASFLIGNERLGLDPHALSLSDEVVKIPMQGSKSSLNVSLATACVVHEYLRQHT